MRALEQVGLIELVRETPVRGAVEHHYRATERPDRDGGGRGPQAPPVARQAMVGSSLDVIAAYARAVSGGGRLRSRRRAAPSCATCGWTLVGAAQLSKACDRLLGQAAKIEAAAAARIAKDPHGEDVVEAGLGLLLFEAVRLSGREDGDKPSARRRPRARRTARASG